MKSALTKNLSILAEHCLPSFITRRLQSLSWLTIDSTYYSGPYSTWEQGQAQSSGYDSEVILEKVLTSTLKVQRGEVPYERDSVVFNHIQYSWLITAGLLWVAAHSSSELSVLDFGGSLGSSYFQNRNFLDGLAGIQWSIVEQPHFVDSGNTHIANEHISFYYSIQDCLTYQKPNVALFSSVLQYLSSPDTVLEEIAKSDIDTIIIDRTSFHDGIDDIILVQNVEKSIYEASYPVWIFSKSKFLDRISRSYNLLAEQLSPEGSIRYASGTFYFNGLILHRVKS